MLHLVSGINSLRPFVNLILVPVSLFVIRLFYLHLPRLIHHSLSALCSSITPSLFHYRLKTYLFHKSFPHSFMSSLVLPSRTIARTISWFSFLVLLSTHADRQGVDILVTVCLCVRLYGYGFLR